MKKFNKISIYLLLILGMAFTACETTDLDLLDDPNNVTIEKADLERFLVAIQIDYKGFMQQMGANSSRLTRINYMFGRTYVNVFDATSANEEWALAYLGILSNIKAAEVLAVSTESNKHLGVMNVIKASTMLTLVDYFGDVPFSQATNPAEFPFPAVDDGASIYAAAEELLNDAIAQLNDVGDPIVNDFFYDNDFAKWIKLANTLKMNIYSNTRLVDSDAVNKFNAIISNGSFISSNEDNFAFRYETSAPTFRHPEYNTDYGVSGGGTYRSTWLMDEMVQTNDPRRRYYFFRQVSCTPGSVDADGVPCAGDPITLFCSTQPRPMHYPAAMAFCNVAEGYWGRDHGDDGGIPPDSFRRTVAGVYPSGGRFDDDDFDFVGIDQGGLGGGVTPIMLASWVDLMRAEFALASNDPSSANNLLQNALNKSISYTQSFISLDSTADSSFEPTSGQVSTFISNIGSAFAAAGTNGKWDILGNQQFIAHYGNGIEAYNFYRRTGAPTSLQFNTDTSFGGPFVRSAFYAADEANTNNNVTQKDTQGVQVFWDTNPSSPGFPFAN